MIEETKFSKKQLFDSTELEHVASNSKFKISRIYIMCYIMFVYRLITNSIHKYFTLPSCDVWYLMIINFYLSSFSFWLYICIIRIFFEVEISNQRNCNFFYSKTSRLRKCPSLQMTPRLILGKPARTCQVNKQHSNIKKTNAKWMQSMNHYFELALWRAIVHWHLNLVKLHSSTTFFFVIAYRFFVSL